MFAIEDSVGSRQAMKLEGISKRYKHFELKSVSLRIPQPAAIVKGDANVWQTSIVWIVLVELVIVVPSIAFSLVLQIRKLDLP